MREFDLDSYDFEELLSASPCTREEARDHLQRGYAAKLPKTSYEIMWERLEEQLGEERAADAVCELIIATAPPRLFELINELWENGTASIRQNDSRLIHMIFDSWEDIILSELGMYFIDYYQHRREDSASPKTGDSITPEPKGSSDVVEHEEGLVYVLANYTVPDLLKVGRTTATSEERAKQISRRTGVPGEWKVVYEFRTDNCRQAEKSVHGRLEMYRDSKQKEFFRAPAKIVIKAMQKVEEEMTR